MTYRHRRYGRSHNRAWIIIGLLLIAAGRCRDNSSSSSRSVGRVAEAPPRPTIYGETRASIEAAVRDLLAPRLIGRPLEDLAGARRSMAFLAGNPTAKGALDVALHDALARERGVTLPALLGAARCLEAMGDARSAERRARADEICEALGAVPFVPLREGPAD